MLYHVGQYQCQALKIFQMHCSNIENEQRSIYNQRTNAQVGMHADPVAAATTAHTC